MLTFNQTIAGTLPSRKTFRRDAGDCNSSAGHSVRKFTRKRDAEFREFFWRGLTQLNGSKLEIRIVVNQYET